MTADDHEKPDHIPLTRASVETVASWAEKILRDIDQSITIHLSKDKNTRDKTR